jgi:hypothetical protein
VQRRRHLKNTSLFGLILVLSSTLLFPAHSSGVESENISWVMPRDYQPGSQIFTLPGEPIGDIRSYLYRTSFQSMVDREDPSCATFSDKKCSGTNFSYRALIPKCEDESSVDCIESFKIKDTNGAETQVEFSEYFPVRNQNSYQGDSNFGIPTGASGGVYKIKNQSGVVEEYFVAAMIDGGGTKEINSRYAMDVRIYKVRHTNVQFGTESKDNGIVRVDNDKQFPGMPIGTYLWASPGFAENINCVVTSVKASNCLERLNFRPDTRFTVSLRLKSVPSGWMHGRLSDPTIKLIKQPKFTNVVVSADPIVTPIVYKKFAWVEMPPSLLAKYEKSTGQYVGGSNGFGSYTAPNVDPLKRAVIIDPTAYSSEAKEQFNLWIPFLNDKSSAENSLWNFHTLASGESLGSNACFNSSTSLTGIVTTNSSTYTAGPPQFDLTTDSLNYQVAAPHFSSNGSTFKGSYDLLMSDQVAKCLYGFSGATAKATISVISAEGVQQVATTSFSSEDGWVHLAARGFTFSSPIVQVKLAKSETPEVTVLPLPSATPILPTPQVTVRKLTIICVKGKVVKKVTAVNPKCPSGYKKK